MTYSIYKLFGSYWQGKFIVGGFKTLPAAKERCADIISHSSAAAKISLEIWDTKTKMPVGWVHSEYKGNKGIYYEDREGKYTRIRMW